MNTLDAIALPDDLIWTNEFNWQAVTQTQDISVSGSLIVQEGKQTAGRKIALKGGDDYAWIDRATLESIYAKVDTADNPMVLTYNGNTYNVVFDRLASGGAVEASTIKGCSDPDGTEFYKISLNFLEV